MKQKISQFIGSSDRKKESLKTESELLDDGEIATE